MMKKYCITCKYFAKLREKWKELRKKRETMPTKKSLNKKLKKDSDIQ